MRAPAWANFLGPIEGVDIWSIWLNQPPEVLAACQEALSEAEWSRFRSFGNRRAADDFAIRRGTIRQLLGDCLGLAPAEVPILQEPRHRPLVVGASVEFSVSSSKDLALFAVSQSASVGIDVEWVDPSLDFKAIVRDNFSEHERLALDGKARPDFFQAWTLKEACAKAIGQGLALPLSSVEVMFSGRVEAPGWPAINAYPLVLPTGYCGAVALVARESG